MPERLNRKHEDTRVRRSHYPAKLPGRPLVPRVGILSLQPFSSALAREFKHSRNTISKHLATIEVTGLQWSQIDMLRRCAWIHADQAKAEKAIGVPLNDEALAIIQLQVGRHDMYVFTYKGEPVTRANNHAWRKALVRAGICDFRWHDLRHTWASWHVQNGTPLHVLKELGGWAELTMVLRYAHLSSKHLAEYAGNSIAIETNLLHEIKPPQIETYNLLN